MHEQEYSSILFSQEYSSNIRGITGWGAGRLCAVKNIVYFRSVKVGTPDECLCLTHVSVCVCNACVRVCVCVHSACVCVCMCACSCSYMFEPMA